MSKFLYVIALISMLYGCKEKTDDSVTFMGVNSHGGVIKHYITKRVANKMASTLQKSSDEVITGLEEVTSGSQKNWSLSRVTVGLNLEAGTDIEIAELESEIAFEMRFEPKK